MYVLACGWKQGSHVPSNLQTVQKSLYFFLQFYIFSADGFGPKNTVLLEIAEVVLYILENS